MIYEPLLKTPRQTDVLILGNGPSLLGRPWAAVPREKTLIFGINQSWREVPDADAHFSADFDQFQFDDPTAAGFGGRAYYEALDARRAVYHIGHWANFGIRLDCHNALVFSRRPFHKRHRGAHVPAPKLAEDGGVALKADPVQSAGSSAYVALQIAAGCGFERYWFVGLDMGAGATKFDGALGYADKFKKTPTSTGAWSNSERHDALWKHVPPDIKDRVRVIGPSATKVLTVVDWPWSAARAVVAA